MIRVEETRPFPGGLAFGLQRAAVSQADQAARAESTRSGRCVRTPVRNKAPATRTRSAGLPLGKLVDSARQARKSARFSADRDREAVLDTFVCSLERTAPRRLALLLTMYYGFWVLSDYMHYVAASSDAPSIGTSPPAPSSSPSPSKCALPRRAATRTVSTTSLPQMKKKLNATQPRPGGDKALRRNRSSTWSTRRRVAT